MKLRVLARRMLPAVVLAMFVLGGPVAGAFADPPVVMLSARPASSYPCYPVVLDAAGSYDPDGLLASAQWGVSMSPYGVPFGPPVAISSTGQTIGQPPRTPITDTVTFNAPGTYTVGVQLTGDGAAQSSMLQSIQINPPQPVVPVPRFSASALVVETGQPVNFDATASYESKYDSNCQTVVNHAMSEYDWDFGDGAVQAPGGPTTSHIYTAPGLYSVILRVTGSDPSAGQAAATHTILVVAPPPPPPPPPATVALSSGALRLDKLGRVAVRVRCLTAVTGCAGSLALRAVKPRLPHHSSARSSTPTEIAAGAFLIRTGGAQTVELKLSASARSWITQLGGKGLAATLVAGQVSALAPLKSHTTHLRLLMAKPTPHKKHSGRAADRIAAAAAAARPQLLNF